MTISVSGYDYEKAIEIEEASIVNAEISESGALILHAAGGSLLNLGTVISVLPYDVENKTATLKSFDSTPDDVTIPEWNDGTSANTKVTNPTIMPTGQVSATAWSPDGMYLAVVGEETAAPYFKVYKRSGDLFEKLSDPPAVDSATVCCGWSANGQYLAVGNYDSPISLTIYKRSGTTFTKVAEPFTTPSGAVRMLAWSPTEDYLAIGVDGDPVIMIYKRSGDTFTELVGEPLIQPVGWMLNDISWSPDGKYLTVCFDDSINGLYIYKKTGDTFTKLADPDITPIGCYKAVWSPSGQYLTVTSYQAPYLFLYKRTGDSLIKLPDMSPTLPYALFAIAWSPDEKYFAVSNSVSPFLTIYKFSLEIFTKIAAPTNAPTTGIGSLTWSPDGKHLSVGLMNSPYLSIYKYATSSFVEATLPVELKP